MDHLSAGHNAQVNDDTIKALFLHAMPWQWRKSFKKVGKKLATETMDLMEEPQLSKKNSLNRNKNNDNGKNHGHNSNPNGR